MIALHASEHTIGGGKGGGDGGLGGGDGGGAVHLNCEDEYGVFTFVQYSPFVMVISMEIVCILGKAAGITDA